MLPSSFPIKQLSPTDLQKVEWFYDRYVEDYYSDYYYGHFLMAAYAAVPGLLTPDLLYKLWQNFNGYYWNGKPVTIHRIAVADVLLSPLCREVGFELYEMHHEIRLAFLEWLHIETADSGGADRGFSPITQVADFLQEYYQQPNPGGQLWGEQYTETQQLEALSYSEPAKVADALKYKMYHAAKEQRETDLLRTIDAFSRTFDRLKRIRQGDTSLLAIYDKQNKWLEAGRALIQQHTEGFLSVLENLDEMDQVLSEDSTQGLPVTVAGNVMEQLETKSPPPVLWGLIVGTENRYAGLTEANRIMRSNDAHLMADCIKHLYDEALLQVLEGESATQQQVLQALSQIAQSAREQDSVLYYFSCNAVKHEEVCYLRCADTEADDLGGGISQAEFREAAKKIRAKQQVLILETPFSGSPQWMDIVADCEHAIIASCTQDQSPHLNEQVLVEQKQHYSFFTFELVRQLKKQKGRVSLRDWMRLTINGFENTPRLRTYYKDDIREFHRPQLYASPLALNAGLIPEDRIPARLESLLRGLGYYSDSADEALTTAIDAFKSEFDLPDDMGARALIRALEKQERAKQRRPVFLLVFSDQLKRLKYLNEEKARIDAVLQERAEQAGIEVVVLEDPDIAALSAVMMDIEYRNRIELFYYSGLDREGDMVLADGGVMTIFDFAPLMEYQERIHLLIANTCRSKYFAERAAQLGARMAIGSERLVTDRFGADFGVQLFEAIIEKGRLIQYDPLAGWSQNISEDEERDKFRLYTAPWQREDAPLPWQWEQEEVREQKEAVKKPPEVKGKRIYAVIMGIDDSRLEPDQGLRFCRKNAQDFEEWLQRYSDATSVPLKTTPQAMFTARATAMGMLESFSQAKDGDICVFFYSGIGFINRSRYPAFADCVFENDTDEVFERSANSQKDNADTVWRKLNRIAEGKKIHLLVIMDFHQYRTATGDLDESFGLHPEQESSLVVLQGPLRTGSDDGEPTDNNYFFESLKDILADSGTSIAYQDLFDRLRLRLSQTPERGVPWTYAQPRRALGYTLLSSRKDKETGYLVSFDPEENNWRISAGALHGIRPSLHFMRTWLRLDDNREVSISEVYPTYSLIADMAEDNTTRVFQGHLVQNALPKVKIAYDKDIDPAMRLYLNRAIKEHDIYYIDIVDDVQQSKFIIRHMAGTFYLVRNTSSMNDRAARQPVFDYQPSEYEFIKQMEYIAKWQGVLEFNNSHSGISKEDLNVEVEVFEGVKLSVNKEVEVKGTEYHNPDMLTLSYKQGLQPAFRCRISLNTATAIEKCYIAVAYLDSTFGIHPEFISGGMDHLTKGDGGVWMSFPGQKATDHTIRVAIDPEVRERGITEIYDYVKIFISNTPVNWAAFKQEGLEYKAIIKRGVVSFDSRAATLKLPDNIWTSITIPLKIVAPPTEA
ncbi:hypothetical protein F0L74_13780 [Chitinophaga agrisoli]|uniref:Peptidase C14 caspase domain-containing protein n=1 Tax=Chitinophaga agrisoli TaxID=2607653 RepID=A0A5B2VZJ6_9BACT|nr:caspase family protein [Chitinophaga agrisoli]KAA2243557.1 hypothetical protein F0L74_13780 [Chitinophaga agrisoli]